MHISAHLLFLLSLGVFSWAILCYFKEIEKRLMCSPINNSQEQSNDFHEVAAHELVRDYRAYRCRDNYELYVNFLCVFACIYALAKVAHIAERYLARQMYGKFYDYNQNVFDNQARLSTAKDCTENLENTLQQKIDTLTKQNLELKFELSRSENVKLGQNAEKALAPGDGLLQNIYISNRHVRLNHKVYVNSSGVMRTFHHIPEKDDKVNDVWQNYLQMQKESHSRMPSVWANIKRESFMPVVLSTEDFQKIHGLF